MSDNVGNATYAVKPFSNRVQKRAAAKMMTGVNASIDNAEIVCQYRI